MNTDSKLPENYTAMTTHSTAPRKPRVHWTALEWEKVVMEYLRRDAAGEFETGRQYDLAGKIRLCQNVLPPDRQCNASRFYHPNFKREVESHIRSAKDRIESRKKLEEHKSRGERNTIQIVADIETRIGGIEDMLDELAKLVLRTSNEQAELRARQADMTRMLAVLVGEPVSPDEAQGAMQASESGADGTPGGAVQGAMQASESGADGTPGPRIDVIGLLNSQAQRLARAVQHINLNLRFVRSEDFHQLRKFMPNAILCVDFAPKNAQAVLREAGVKVTLVSGNVSNVVRTINEKWGSK